MRAQFAGDVAFMARVQQCNLRAGARQFARGGVCRVVVGRHHDARPGQDGIAVQIGAPGGREHDPGAVVVAESEVALERAGGDDDVLGAQCPEALARQMRGGRGEVAGDALERAGDAAIV